MFEKLLPVFTLFLLLVFIIYIPLRDCGSKYTTYTYKHQTISMLKILIVTKKRCSFETIHYELQIGRKDTANEVDLK